VLDGAIILFYRPYRFFDHEYIRDVEYVLFFENPESSFVKIKRRKYDTINTSTSIETRVPGVRATRVTRVSVINLSHPAIIT
jgi:hypothetical protein